MDSALWGLIGTIVGALASILTTVLTNWNTTKIKAKENKEELRERAISFQRETLLNLQDELANYIRLFHLLHIEDLNDYDKTGYWGIATYDELDEEKRVSSSKTSILIERISDDDLRNSLKKLKSSVAECMLANTKEESENFRTKVSIEYDICNQKIGTVLRNSY